MPSRVWPRWTKAVYVTQAIAVLAALTYMTVDVYGASRKAGQEALRQSRRNHHLLHVMTRELRTLERSSGTRNCATTTLIAVALLRDQVLPRATVKTLRRQGCRVVLPRLPVPHGSSTPVPQRAPSRGSARPSRSPPSPSRPTRSPDARRSLPVSRSPASPRPSVCVSVSRVHACVSVGPEDPPTRAGFPVLPSAILAGLLATAVALRTGTRTPGG